MSADLETAFAAGAAGSPDERPPYVSIVLPCYNEQGHVID